MRSDSELFYMRTPMCKGDGEPRKLRTRLVSRYRSRVLISFDLLQVGVWPVTAGQRGSSWIEALTQPFKYPTRKSTTCDIVWETTFTEAPGREGTFKFIIAEQIKKQSILIITLDRHSPSIQARVKWSTGRVYSLYQPLPKAESVGPELNHPWIHSTVWPGLAPSLANAMPYSACSCSVSGFQCHNIRATFQFFSFIN